VNIAKIFLPQRHESTKIHEVFIASRLEEIATNSRMEFHAKLAVEQRRNVFIPQSHQGTKIHEVFIASRLEEIATNSRMGFLAKLAVEQRRNVFYAANITSIAN
jgi:hypothetical protein